MSLMSLLRRERLYRSALGWFGGRPTVRGREPRRGRAVAQHNGSVCRRARRRPPVRHDEAPVEKTLLGDESRRARVRCLSMCWLKLELEKWIKSKETADTCSSSTPPTAGRPRVKSNNERSNNVESRRASHCAVVWPNTIDDGPRGCGCGAGVGCAACAALGVWLRRCQRRACRCRAPPPADSSSCQQSCASARRRAR